MKKYEYAIEKSYPFLATEKELNTMGDDGWELTGVIAVQERDLITETYYYYFKRQLTNEVKDEKID